MEGTQVLEQIVRMEQIVRGLTFSQAKSCNHDQAESDSQKAQKSYADVVRDNRSTHSIELIK